ncbi:MAG: hypothetical protein OXC09_01205 [Truepera sp.]|nr:hypothetical protein [Truepera sp.]
MGRFLLAALALLATTAQAQDVLAAVPQLALDIVKVTGATMERCEPEIVRTFADRGDGYRLLCAAVPGLAYLQSASAIDATIVEHAAEPRGLWRREGRVISRGLDFGSRFMVVFIVERQTWLRLVISWK